MKLRKIAWIQCLATAVLLGALLASCGNNTAGNSGGVSGTTNGSDSTSTTPAYSVNTSKKTITAADGSWEVDVRENEAETSTTITKTYATALTSLSTSAPYAVVEDSVTDCADSSQLLDRVLAISETSLNDMEAALMRTVLSETDGVFYAVLRLECDTNSVLQAVTLYDPSAEDKTPVCGYTVNNDVWDLTIETDNELLTKLKAILVEPDKELQDFLREEASATQSNATELQALVDTELNGIIARGVCGAQLKWTLDKNGLLTISGIGKMRTYTASGDIPWAAYCEQIKEVKLQNGITKISDSAFAYCPYLTSVSIPASVTSISDDAFMDCTSLTGLFIPSGVTNIGACAFWNCRSLVDISIPDSVTSIGDRAFWFCRSLTNISIPGSVTSISDYAFYACSSLATVSISDGVTGIGGHAFEDCSSLKNISMPSSMIRIGEGAFTRCLSLTDISIPYTVTSIGNWAFYGCASLQSISIPYGITSIGTQTFADCSSLTSVSIPGSVTSIGGSVFENCSNLTNVVLGYGVRNLGGYMFKSCYALQRITIPNSVTSIEEAAFLDCESLADVYYTGSEADWASITIASDNDELTAATIYYNHTPASAEA